jgi:glycine hydroxymethyltransferase
MRRRELPMTALARRDWVPEECENKVAEIARHTAACDAEAIAGRLTQLIDDNRRIHEAECVNLNPATNVMNPKAEAALSAGLGSRPSLGYPGGKYEMGLEAIETIEVIAAELVGEIFQARFAEIRVPSGALANLFAFMATTQPGDDIIVPPEAIGGHVTHHRRGAAGLYGLHIHDAAIDAARYTVDVEGLRRQARALCPKLITIGGSLNLFAHPIREIRAIADEVGAYLLFDAAHLSGMIAGRAWQQPLQEGAHLMTMSTYKSLGGPPSGLILTNDAVLAKRLDAIAFPGLTANFDAAKMAALAITMLDWKVHGNAYAIAMRTTAQALARALIDLGLPVHARQMGATQSHQFALEAAGFGGGQNAAKRLRQAHILSCGIGLPISPVGGDLNGLRFGSPEIVRRGMSENDMPELAGLIGRALIGNEEPGAVARDTMQLRQRFKKLHFIR